MVRRDVRARTATSPGDRGCRSASSAGSCASRSQLRGIGGADAVEMLAGWRRRDDLEAIDSNLDRFADEAAQTLLDLGAQRVQRVPGRRRFPRFHAELEAARRLLCQLELAEP